MSDNNILKALEICAINKSCAECPFLTANERGSVDCISFMSKQAIEVINRQKAEIEGLQKRIVFWKDDLNYNPIEVRIKAIKEFAEKTHKKITEIYNKHIFDYDLIDTEKEAIMDFSADVESGIDSLVEEMTEEHHEA